VAVAAARSAGAEVVIVSLHTFRERDPAPTPLDRDFTTRLVAEADIDLVVQHGPHVVQPLELVGGTWVFWSVGNLVSAMGEPGDPRYGPTALDGLLAWVRFTESASIPGRFDVHPTPVVVCAEIGSRHVYPGVATLEGAAAPPIGSGLRTQLEACVARTKALVPSAI
jgi:poly-gamma-glutamate capsule biosynthesis protein CapA/YwtB (metallophosphatase superfamily)